MKARLLHTLGEVKRICKSIAELKVGCYGLLAGDCEYREYNWIQERDPDHKHLKENYNDNNPMTDNQ